MDMTRRASDRWIIDFGWTMSEADAALYEVPFRHALSHVQPERSKNNREAYRLNWWRHVEPRPGLMKRLATMDRCIVTPEVAKHRLFCWFDTRMVPDHKLQVIASDSPVVFGILHSRIHEVWALRTGSWHGAGNDPRYTISTTFETFPFPAGLTPNLDPQAQAEHERASDIASAAEELDRLRGAWLNPGDLVSIEPEVIPGYPDRALAVDEHAAAVLRARTLTNLYNERPAWLDNAHKALDAAVAAAYGWPADLSDNQIIERLFDLNQARSGGHP